MKFRTVGVPSPLWRSSVLIMAACAPVAAPGSAAAGPCNEVEVTEDDGGYDLGGCTLRIAVENAYQPFNFIDTETGEGSRL